MRLARPVIAEEGRSVIAACRRLGDVVGALQRPALGEENRAELQAESASAIGILDRETGFTE